MRIVNFVRSYEDSWHGRVLNAYQILNLFAAVEVIFTVP